MHTFVFLSNIIFLSEIQASTKEVLIVFFLIAEKSKSTIELLEKKLAD